ncbi:MAG: mevalonate kinase [Candidatus Micrarchaeia archaeon]
MFEIVEVEAPVKVIISGEHGVVHGAPGLAIALEPCNKVVLSESEGEAGVEITSDRGKVFVKSDGSVEGPDEEKKTFEPFVAVVDYLKQKKGLSFDKHLVAEIQSARAPKGVGNSASIAAALALALFTLMGRKPVKGSSPEENELWNAVQVADAVAHGERPSGIDAMVVSYGNTELLRFVKDGQAKWRFTPKPGLTFPNNTELLVVDTFKGRRSDTGAVVLSVARGIGITKRDSSGKEVVKHITELSDEDKAGLQPFWNAYEKIVKNLHADGSARELGEGFNDNHVFLKKCGASTVDIEKVVEVSLGAGALGAKLTGAGGIGGAVIVLVKSGKKDVVEKAIKNAGFSIFEAKAAGHGARILK